MASWSAIAQTVAMDWPMLSLYDSLLALVEGASAAALCGRSLDADGCRQFKRS